jgi:hypothetical protein
LRISNKAPREKLRTLVQSEVLSDYLSPNIARHRNSLTFFTALICITAFYLLVVMVWLSLRELKDPPPLIGVFLIEVEAVAEVDNACKALEVARRTPPYGRTWLLTPFTPPYPKGGA